MTAYKFSIITPCFRGKDFLRRAYTSLLNQKGSHAFEWIIVDDYSNDEDRTRSVIDQVRREAPFPVKAIFLEQNYFGSMSVYRGASVARGEYILILDQDDLLDECALNVFSSAIEKARDNSKFVGVCGRCVDLTGRLIGTPFPWPEMITNELAIRHHAKIRGEMFQCTKREVIVEYFAGMKPGFTNGWAWARIARKYDYLYTSAIVRHYDTTNPASVSNSKKITYIQAQYEALTNYILNNEDYLCSDKLWTFRLLAQRYRIGKHCGLSKAELASVLPPAYRGWFDFSYLVAMIRVLRDRQTKLV